MTRSERHSEANRAMTWVKARGQEHLALDPLEGEDRDEGQGDDELAENAGFADFQNRLKARSAASPCRLRTFGEMPLDVFDLDDRRVDDHPDADGQSAERHQVGRKAGQAHGDEGEQHRQGQGQDDDERPPEAAEEQVQDQDDEQRPDDQRLADRVDAGLDDVRPLIERDDFQCRPEEREPALISATRASTARTTSRPLAPRSIMTTPPTASPRPSLTAAPWRTAWPARAAATSPEKDRGPRLGLEDDPLHVGRRPQEADAADQGLPRSAPRGCCRRR